jgi:hypothetical protein
MTVKQWFIINHNKVILNVFLPIAGLAAVVEAAVGSYRQAAMAGASAVMILGIGLFLRER